jgi:hypothetical protein
MAIIYSYPKVTSPLATDVLVLTDTTLTAGKRKNKTKSLALSDLASYVVSTTSGITGSGTTNTLPIWSDGPNGVLSDSPIKLGTGTDSLILGAGTSAIGNYSVATGSGTTASANNSFAGGLSTLASGLRSFAMGGSTVASLRLEILQQRVENSLLHTEKDQQLQVIILQQWEF